MNNTAFIADTVEAIAEQTPDTDTRVGMFRWVSQFRAGSEQVTERIHVSAARALYIDNYGDPYPGNVAGVGAAVAIATALASIEAGS